MGKDEAFLKAIGDAPVDVALRLVYADWLEEQGDPRGEIIRLEAEMASRAATSDEYVLLKARRNQLRPQIDAAWLTKMGYVPRHRPLFRELPPRRVERWRLVEEFIEVWFRPLRVGDGFSEAELAEAESRLGFPLPAALREWYALSGRRGDVWSTQDDLLGLQDLKLDREDNALLFRRECQVCDWWGIRAEDLTSEDPPVFRFDSRVSRPRATPRNISPTITAFAIAVLLLHLPNAGRFVSGHCEGPDVWREIQPKLSACGLPDRCCRAGTSPDFFYEGTDVIVSKSIEDDMVVVVARTEEALGNLSETLRQRLERYG
jgi:uncharacterized protein (TIGR02996 family)